MSQAANLSAMMSGTTLTVPNLTYTGTLTGVSQNLSGNLTANNIVSSNNVTYSGTLTGGTGVIAIGTNQIYKDASGNVGLGVTPSAWTLGRAIQISQSASFNGQAGVNAAYMNANAYYGSGGWTYINNDLATSYRQYNGTHGWFSAAAGTGAISAFASPTMTLGADARLFVNNTSNPSGQITTTGGITSWLVSYGGTNTSSLMNAGATNDMLILYAPFSATAASAPNSGAKWGIRFQGAVDGNYASTGKTCAIYAVSEDGAAGYNRANGLAFYTNAFDTAYAERVRIDSSGNLGIGTASPSKKLEVFASANSLQIESIVRNDQAGSGVAAIGFNVSSSAAGDTSSTKAGIGLVRQNTYGVGSLCFYNSATTSAGDFTTADERARIDSSGNLVIGGTASYGRFTVYPATTPTTTAGANQIWIGEATLNSNYRLQVGYGLYGGAYKGTIQSYAGGVAGDLVVCAAGGSLTVGATSVNPVGDRTNGLVLQQTGILVRGVTGSSYFGLNATSGVHIVFYTDNGSAYVTAGNISSSSGTTLYNATSDQRLKENIVDAPNALSSINAIKVRSFDWKSDGSHSEYGYIAQELLEVAPEAVHVPTDPEEMMGVDFGKLTPRLVKAIQELTTRLEALEAK